MFDRLIFDDMLQGVSVNLAFMARFSGWKLDLFNQAIEWERIRCPVLVVLGGYDFMMPPIVWDVQRRDEAPSMPPSMLII